MAHALDLSLAINAHRRQPQPFAGLAPGRAIALRGDPLSKPWVWPAPPGEYIASLRCLPPGIQFGVFFKQNFSQMGQCSGFQFALLLDTVTSRNSGYIGALARRMITHLQNGFALAEGGFHVHTHHRPDNFYNNQ